MVRISDDKAEEARGVGRQETDGRAKAEQLGWTIAEVVTENDTSAFKRRKVSLPDGRSELRTVRPGFRDALDKLASGVCDGLIADDLDRVARDIRDLEDLIDIVEQRHIPAVATTGSMHLDNDAGITMARIMCSIANKASRDTSRRVARAQQQLAAEGKPPGGGYRGYGYTRSGMEIIPEEAAAIRDMASMVLDGVSMNAIAAEMNRRGVPSATGVPWSGRSVRGVLCKPSVAGLRAHKGQVVAKATWKAILDEDTWTVCKRIIAGRAGTTDLTLKRWLTGVLHCSLCGHMLSGNLGNSGPRYWCNSGRGGCGKIAIKAGSAETEVERQVLELLTHPDVLNRLSTVARSEITDDVRKELAEDEEQLKQLAGMWARKELSFTEFREARTIIEARVKDSRAMIHSTVPRTVRNLITSDVFAGWAALSPAGKREVVLTVLPGGYAVAPAKATGGVFDPSRLVPRVS